MSTRVAIAIHHSEPVCCRCCVCVATHHSSIHFLALSRSTMNRLYRTAATATSLFCGCVHSFHISPRSSLKTWSSSSLSSSTVATTDTVPSSPWFTDNDDSIPKLKTQILQLGAALDRGQSYNPTSGEYYSSSMDVARSKIQSLIAMAGDDNVPKSLDDIAGGECHCHK